MKRKILLPAILLCLLALLCAAYAEGVPSLTFEQAELVLVKEKTQRVKYTLENVEHPKKAKLAWESSDRNVATVDKTGLVKGKDGGSAVITCTAELEDGTVLTASVPVTVTVPVRSVKILTKSGTVLPYGQSLQIETAIAPENATDKTLTWASSDEAILRVDENGTVTALSAGTATITATASNKSKTKISLKVPTLSAPAETFELTRTDSVFTFTYCGSDFDSNVKLASGGGCFDYSLIRNDPEIGIRFVAVAPGEDTLTVTDKKGKCSFSVRVLVTEDSFLSGRMLQINRAVYNPQTGDLNVTWTNTGSSAVTGAELRICPRDAEGRALTAGDGSIGNILQEHRVLHTSLQTAPGAAMTDVFPVGTDYPGAVSMDIAFDRWTEAVTAEDGTVTEYTETELPDDRLCWYSTAQADYAANPENGTAWSGPDAETLALAGTVSLGIRTVPVTGDLAEAYGLARSGLMITEIRKDSPAEALGLLPGDILWSANGVPYSTEPYFLTLACAGLAQDKPAALMIDRGDASHELKIRRNEDGTLSGDGIEEAAAAEDPESGIPEDPESGTATDLDGTDPDGRYRLARPFPGMVSLTDRIVLGGSGPRIYIQNSLDDGR